MVGFATARRRVFVVARLSGCELLEWNAMPSDDVKVETLELDSRGSMKSDDPLAAGSSASWGAAAVSAAGPLGNLP